MLQLLREKPQMMGYINNFYSWLQKQDPALITILREDKEDVIIQSGLSYSFLEDLQKIDALNIEILNAIVVYTHDEERDGCIELLKQGKHLWAEQTERAVAIVELFYAQREKWIKWEDEDFADGGQQEEYVEAAKLTECLEGMSAILASLPPDCPTEIIN